MSSGIPMPEGQVAKRELHFFWLADYSGSMSGKKIATLNQAIREALPAIQQAVAQHPEIEIKMRAIKFADTADWHVGPNAVHVNQFVWPELGVDGCTSTAQAIRRLAEQLTTDQMPQRGLPPVCILISDGCCTESPSTYDRAIQDLVALPWGKKSVRLAIAIGEERDYDEKELLKFVSHPEIGVLKAESVEQLVGYIKWASVEATVGASLSRSKAGTPTNNTSQNVILPPPPAITSSGDIF